VRALIPMVTRNNDRLAELSHEILQPQAGAPKPLANLAIDISGHVYLENEILFPRALKLLE
jgi:iron-sulfur cluster repair protein YtfE (RIC family)